MVINFIEKFIQFSFLVKNVTGDFWLRMYIPFDLENED